MHSLIDLYKCQLNYKENLEQNTIHNKLQYLWALMPLTISLFHYLINKFTIYNYVSQSERFFSFFRINLLYYHAFKHEETC
jgi:hypothetical protein